jgi:hypothetical protein
MAALPDPQTPRRGLLGAIAAHLRSELVSRVLYGSIIGLALVVALSSHPPRPGEVVAKLLATGVAVALAESFSEYIGTQTRTGRRVGRREKGEIAERATAVAVGIAFPAVFFVLAAAEVISRDTAFDVATWSGLGLITAYGFAAARLTGSTFFLSLRRAALAGLIGAFVIALEALVH